MKKIDLVYQTMLAELGQLSMDAAWTADFPPEGRFQRVVVKEKTTGTSTFQMVPVGNPGAMSVQQKMLRSRAASKHTSGRKMIFSHDDEW